MDSAHSTEGTPPTAAAVTITQVAERQWHAVQDDRVIGRGDASPRPDGRIFVSIDSWHSSVFDQLADAMLATLPTPLYTLADESDQDLTSGWARVGFTTRRREWEYVVSTAGIDPVPPPTGLTIVPVGAVLENPLRELYTAIRAEVEATTGWDSMPAEVIHRPVGTVPHDPSKYAVAAESGRYAGMIRVATRRRHARIGLVAVLTDSRRRGIARALLTHMLNSLHQNGIETASAEVDESNTAATALFDGIGAHRANSTLELVLR